MGWPGETPFHKLKSRRRDGFECARVRVKCCFREFPAFPIGALSSREGAQLEAEQLGCGPKGHVGVPGLVSTSQFVFHGFLVILFLQVGLLRFL